MNRIAVILATVFAVFAISGCSDDPAAPDTPENYVVHFDKNNASATGTMADISAPSGEVVTLIDNAFTYTGLSFTGWNTESGGGGMTYDDGASYTMTEADITMYAQWEDVYLMGETGPAGGLVFYDKGSYSDGWRYIAASPADLTATVWGTWGQDLVGAAGTAMGTGRQNTLDIAAEDPHTGNAAHACLGYSRIADNEVYNNWYLPSKDELNAMYVNLHLNGIGEFNSDPVSAFANYFSSTEYNAGWAWRQFFVDGTQYESGVKSYDMSVRAVRYF